MIIVLNVFLKVRNIISIITGISLILNGIGRFEIALIIHINHI
jgi:hypothetical protein